MLIAADPWQCLGNIPCPLGSLICTASFVLHFYISKVGQALETMNIIMNHYIQVGHGIYKMYNPTKHKYMYLKYAQNIPFIPNMYHVFYTSYVLNYIETLFC